MGRRSRRENPTRPYETVSDSLRSLDTSFVMRLLTGDPPKLYESAARFLTEQGTDKPHEVPDLVLAEAYFALTYHYGYSKTDALAALLSFSQHPAITVSDHAGSALALPGIASAKPGFVDRLIHGCALSAGRVMVTFEKSARSLPGTLVLE